MEEEKKNFKVIIVDDDKFLLNMYAMKFEKEGVVVEATESGEDLLNKLRGGMKADLILLDIIIPGLDGMETLKKIRAENLGNGMKVIMLTNQADPEEIKKAEAIGIDGYIVKATAVPSEVVQKVMAILKK